jgi:hypothetical protein
MELKYDYKNSKPIAWLEPKKFSRKDGQGDFVVWSGIIKSEEVQQLDKEGVKVQSKLVSTQYGERMVLEVVPKLGKATVAKSNAKSVPVQDIEDEIPF